MNIHCSACGAPLPAGVKFCPACALPLTANAMPPPPPRPAPLWPWLVGAFFVFFVILATATNHSAAAHDEAPQPIRAAFGIDQGLERRVEQDVWFSTAKLHHWREEVTRNLAEAERRQNEPGATQVIAADRAALARIDARLKELHAQ